MLRARAYTRFFLRKSANLPQMGLIALKYKWICVWQICGRLGKMWQIVADCGDSFWEKVHFPSGIIQLHVSPLEKFRYRPTLHVASAHAPCSIGPRSTEQRLTLHVASAHAPQPPLNLPLKGDTSDPQPPLNLPQKGETSPSPTGEGWGRGCFCVTYPTPNPSP